MIHERAIQQKRIGNLIIAKCSYGTDYYWRGRDGYLMTINRGSISIGHNTLFHIMYGLIVNQRTIICFPKWWKDSRLCRLITGWKSHGDTINE